ncbi:9870_t:CDS:2, partial [Cetraspora pellucida]
NILDIFKFNSISMLKRSKRTRQLLEAIRKHWKQAKNSDKELESEPVEELKSRIVAELEPKPVEYEEVVSEMQIENPDELLDAKPDECDECFSTFLINVEVPKSYIENYDFTFDDTYNSSDNDNSKFTLRSLDFLLKNKSDDLWLKTVSQYLHLVQNQGFSKMDATTYEGENLDQIIPSLLLSEIVPITQDELLFYTKNKDESQLRQKLQDLSIHVSDFICESIGCLQLSEEECAINNSLLNNEQLIYTEACVVMHSGTNHNGWWTSKDLIKQISECAILIFEQTHLGKVALFLFDNSCNYNAFADNALVVTRINMKDGSKQPLLRNGQKPDGSTHIMMFTDIDGVVKPKGI